MYKIYISAISIVAIVASPPTLGVSLSLEVRLLRYFSKGQVWFIYRVSKDSKPAISPSGICHTRCSFVAYDLQKSLIRPIQISSLYKWTAHVSQKRQGLRTLFSAYFKNNCSMSTNLSLLLLAQSFPSTSHKSSSTSK